MLPDVARCLPDVADVAATRSRSANALPINLTLDFSTQPVAIASHQPTSVHIGPGPVSQADAGMRGPHETGHRTCVPSVCATRMGTTAPVHA